MIALFGSSPLRKRSLTKAVIAGVHPVGLFDDVEGMIVNGGGDSGDSVDPRDAEEYVLGELLEPWRSKY